MRQLKMTTLYQILLASALACLTSLSFAQTAANFPNRSIKIVVPFAPGGSSDFLARLVAQRMTTDWGQTVIVENKPGAGATLGADLVAKAPADGYTLLLAATHHIIAQNVYKTVPYDIGRDFAPVSVIALIPNMVVVNTNLVSVNNPHRQRPRQQHHHQRPHRPHHHHHLHRHLNHEAGIIATTIIVIAIMVTKEA
jgi:hypothetical protein